MSAPRIAATAAILAALLGLLMMLAWLLGIHALVQLSADFAPIQFNTALCILLAGVALFSEPGRRLVPLASAVMIAAIAGLTAIEYFVDVNFGIDQLLVDASFATARTLQPGRMSPPTTAGLLIISASILAAARTGPALKARVLGGGGWLVGVLAMTTLIGYATAINDTSGWLGFTRASPQTAIGFLLIATSLIAWTWTGQATGIPAWTVPASISTCWVFGLLLFIGLLQRETQDTRSLLPQVVFAAFVLLGLALGGVLRLYRQAAVMRQAAVEARERIEALVDRMVHTELVAKLALENTQQGVWDFDISAGTTTVDEGFRAIVGRDPLVQPLRDQTWHSVVHDDDIGAVRQALRASLEGRQDLYEVRFRVKTATGAWLWVDSRGRVVERAPDGRAVRMVGTLRDVSDRVRAEERLRDTEATLEQARKLEAIGRLAGGVAHHVNNQMTVVIGHTDLLMEGAASADQPSVAAIRRAAEATADISRQLLALGQRQFLKPVTFSIETLIERLAAAIRTRIGPDITLHLSLQAGAVESHADPAQVEWVIWSLIDNARDAMRNGGRLSIATRRVDADSETPRASVAVDVSDTGTGIGADDLARIFEPFFTRKAFGGGHGLSLASCYGIVKQSGGSLTVRSEPGCGTSVTMLLPLVDVGGE